MAPPATTLQCTAWPCQRATGVTGQWLRAYAEHCWAPQPLGDTLNVPADSMKRLAAPEHGPDHLTMQGRPR